MSIAVRPAEARDASAIRAVHLAAFPDATEADLVGQLDKDGASVLSLVAEEDGEIVGHILMSRMRVEGDGRGFRALGIAPVAVVPERQRAGIGSALIREALARARDAGEQLVFLVGEPDYYRRFGFAAATAARFASPYAGSYFMARALTDVDLPRRGRADYAPAFAGLE
ncbi:MAG TPA: N-acetyltransferase [Allosphingosinicella sp.]|nr:N-acetyltransferase [Allosphingosinicella sp.]